jgi:hypothetical protein
VGNTIRFKKIQQEGKFRKTLDDPREIEREPCETQDPGKNR